MVERYLEYALIKKQRNRARRHSRNRSTISLSSVERYSERAFHGTAPSRRAARSISGERVEKHYVMPGSGTEAGCRQLHPGRAILSGKLFRPLPGTRFRPRHALADISKLLVAARARARAWIQKPSARTVGNQDGAFSPLTH